MLASTLMPWCETGNGTWKTSGGIGPKPRLYGAVLPVSAMDMKLRPWNAPENAISAERPVALRAIFTAFSTASAPVEKKMERAGEPSGARAFKRSARAM